jgi:hypothetical protein
LETFDIYGVTLLLTPAPCVFSFATHWPQEKRNQNEFFCISGFLAEDPLCEERQVDQDDECCVLVTILSPS